MTQNIPECLPIVCGDDFTLQILEWMKGRSEHPDDYIINRLARWKYEIVDQHITSQVKVTDRATGEVFSPQDDPEKW